MSGSDVRGRREGDRSKRQAGGAVRGRTVHPQVRQERRVYVLRVEASVSREKGIFGFPAQGHVTGCTVPDYASHAAGFTTGFARAGQPERQPVGRPGHDRDGTPGDAEALAHSDAIAQAGRADPTGTHDPGRRPGRRGASVRDAQALAGQGVQAEEARQAGPGGDHHRPAPHGATWTAADRHGGGKR